MKKVIDEINDVSNTALDEIEQIVTSTEGKFEQVVQPIRDNILKRFPILFTLAVTFGLTWTLVGMEQIILKYEILQNNPTTILFLGIAILVATGTLYKKLG